MIEDKKRQMKKVRDEVWNLKGDLSDERRKNDVYPVLGEGSHDAHIVFIGEAPGKNEAKEGRPFVGRAGKILDELIESVTLKREDVYITNIVKDRPTQNRDPHPEEIETYAPFLDRQIEIIQPKIIATLGRFSMEYIMERYELADKIAGISKIHGQSFETQTGYGTVRVIPLFHPAVAAYNPTSKAVLLEDFKILQNVLKE